MSSVTDLFETAEDPATKDISKYLEGDAEKPDASVWIQMLSETTGVVLKVATYYVSYEDGVVTVHSQEYSDEHDPRGKYVESLLDYYDPQPVYEKEVDEEWM